MTWLIQQSLQMLKGFGDVGYRLTSYEVYQSSLLVPQSSTKGCKSVLRIFSNVLMATPDGWRRGISNRQWGFIATIPSQMKRHTASLCWPRCWLFASWQNASSVTESYRQKANDVRGIHTSLAVISPNQSSSIGKNGANNLVIEIKRRCWLF